MEAMILGLLALAVQVVHLVYNYKKSGDVHAAVTGAADVLDKVHALLNEPEPEPAPAVVLAEKVEPQPAPGPTPTPVAVANPPAQLAAADMPRLAADSQ